MNKASPIVPIDGFTRAGVDAVEDAPALAADFVDVRSMNIKPSYGVVQPTDIVTADIPLWDTYQKGRLLAKPPVVNSGALTDLTAALYGRMPDGSIYLIGQVVAVNNLLPPIEFDITPGMQYATRITALDGTSPDIDQSFGLQAFNTDEG